MDENPVDQEESNRSTPNATLRILRERLGKTQKEFAAMLFVTASSVQKWETGKRPLPKARAQQIYELTGANIPPLMIGNVEPTFRVFLDCEHEQFIEEQPYSKKLWKDYWEGQALTRDHIAHTIGSLISCLLTAILARVRSDELVKARRSFEVCASLACYLKELERDPRLSGAIEDFKQDEEWSNKVDEFTESFKDWLNFQFNLSRRPMLIPTRCPFCCARVQLWQERWYAVDWLTRAERDR